MLRSVPAHCSFAAAAVVVAMHQTATLQRRTYCRSTRGMLASVDSINSSNQQSAASQGRGSDNRGGSPLPWSYETIDPVSGKTTLEASYEKNRAAILELFEKPLPTLPDDGNVHPHFLVGFGHYSYRLRDQYRSVLAGRLGLHPSEVRLSIAWGGRFDVSRLRNCRKVCGVVLEPLAAALATLSGHAEGDSVTAEAKAAAKDVAKQWDDTIRRFVSVVAKRKDAELLNLHMIAAGEAIPEVAFTQMNLLHRALADAIAEVSRRTLVLFVYEHASERQRMEQEWLKAFVDRKAIPEILSLGELLEQCKQHLLQLQESGSEQYNRDGTDFEKLVANVTTADVTAALGKLSHGLHHLPALFCNGVHVGSTYQIQFLMKQRSVLDTILLRPNDIHFAAKYVSGRANGGTGHREVIRTSEAAHAGTHKVHT